MIEKGPIYWWSSFADGELDFKFQVNTQTLSPMAKLGVSCWFLSVWWLYGSLTASRDLPSLCCSCSRYLTQSVAAGTGQSTVRSRWKQEFFLYFSCIWQRRDFAAARYEYHCCMKTLKYQVGDSSCSGDNRLLQDLLAPGIAPGLAWLSVCPLFWGWYTEEVRDSMPRRAHQNLKANSSPLSEMIPIGRPYRWNTSPKKTGCFLGSRCGMARVKVDHLCEEVLRAGKLHDEIQWNDSP